MRKKNLRIFIFDDVRNIKTALLEANFTPPEDALITLVRPYIWDGTRIDACYDNAFDTVLSNPTFNVWVLDNDLSKGLEGFQFLKDMIARYPEKMPDVVKSCSLNSARRIQIESYFLDWQKASKEKEI